MTGDCNTRRMCGLRLRAPSVALLESMRRDGELEPFTYGPVGVVERGGSLPGFRRDRWARTIGHGERVFDAAASALLSWDLQRRSGLVVHSDGPPAPGRVVAMAAPLPILYVDVVCRVVDVIDEPRRRGFVYGTLSCHPEIGEESFAIAIDDGGEVTLQIAAVWRLRHPLARLAPPVARFFQRRATEGYFEAMGDIVGETV